MPKLKNKKLFLFAAGGYIPFLVAMLNCALSEFPT